MEFQNSYLNLGKNFYQQILPTPVENPQLLLWNQQLAKTLQLSGALNDDHDRAQILSGNRIHDSSTPIALAYSGHQFGHFNPQLGDGRAHLLGELFDLNKRRFDIQLKGSGATRFSRQGDGRCALKPALRELIMSEALHALNIPSSRCLAVVSTGETVYRDLPQPGAIVTRVAQSHLRVGTFQHFGSRGDTESLKKLLDYAINRHYPEIDVNADEAQKALEFLSAVSNRQITLVCHWLRVGFIHGVMNTDNTTISGETIDYGPCAMMGDYHPGTVFSSIDAQGRYAYGNQINIAIWNMARLAESLLPLLAPEQDAAISKAETVIKQLVTDFTKAYRVMLANKLGFAYSDESDWHLIETFLGLMQSNELDYTQTFLALTQMLNGNRLTEETATILKSWLPDWLQRLGISGSVDEITTKAENHQQSATSIPHEKTDNVTDAITRMQHANPAVIPRNHHVEDILERYQQALLSGKGKQQAQTQLEQFLSVLRTPYCETELTAQFQDAAKDKDKGYRTFCGT
ncbi:YdiU family protein [Thalassotalea litorea]|uniref:Protein nucleotidyltransferase YdiU n=1 Tax=Thalassotalea litorea TaxID=2020715 RepID=A0A5R9IMZ3_9GAMM|nr:YdiU family protein [Thalassotalea litorea]TLU64606.1 YdiU family protein [Thalassotalea litorea]